MNNATRKQFVFGILLLITLQGLASAARPEIRKPAQRPMPKDIRTPHNTPSKARSDEDEDDVLTLRGSKDKDEDKKDNNSGGIAGVLGGNIMDLIIVVIRAIFNPFNWRDDLCKDQWSSDKRSMEDLSNVSPLSSNSLKRDVQGFDEMDTEESGTRKSGLANTFKDIDFRLPKLSLDEIRILFDTLRALPQNLRDIFRIGRLIVTNKKGTSSWKNTVCSGSKINKTFYD